MMEFDVRWRQRFSNYKKALNKLREAVEYITENNGDSQPILKEIVNEGLVQRFEYTHELAWNLMKDYAEYQGNNSIGGSRDATREALNIKLIEDGTVWMDMIRSRNETSHTYNEETANAIVKKIMVEYLPVMLKLSSSMEARLRLCNTD
jgi:nucleotidyltransferase substrate binding protein (TIGR01987 family)